MPSSNPRARFLADLSEGEKTVEEGSISVCPLLYASIPDVSESGTEAEDDTDSGTTKMPQRKLIATSSKQTEDQLPELYGRSRAILKTYFEETKAFKLPPGHPIVAFTEPQAHLLRVLTDETLRMSYNTLERMVIDAIKGTPTTAPSRTDHFRIKARASTPFRHSESDSSDAEGSAPLFAESDAPETTDHGELGHSSTFGESDSAGEMALISASFRLAAVGNTPGLAAITTQARDVEMSSQETDLSNQDVTLSEVRERTLSEKFKGKTTTKKTIKPKRQSQRGVPMREKIVAKIGRTRSSRPTAQPLHGLVPHL